jgi:hypothetical protein
MLALISIRTIVPKGRLDMLSCDDERNHLMFIDGGGAWAVLSFTSRDTMLAAMEYIHSRAGSSVYMIAGRYRRLFLFVIGFEVFCVYQVQFYCAYYETGYVDTFFAIGEEPGYQFVLPFFK